MIKEFFEKKFANPYVKGLDIDSVSAVDIHSRIIRENSLLNQYYRFIYQHFKKTEDSLSGLAYPSVEIGSGGGFLKDYIPDVITSDVVVSRGIDRKEDVSCLSFADNSLKAVYAIDVLHHVKDLEASLNEIQRVLVKGGRFVCNEPSSTLFGYFMNKHFHKEYTNKHIKEWKIQGQARLSDANMALPYVVFKRDADLFHERFRHLKISSIFYHDFLRYTLSGGLSYKPFVPKMFYGAVSGIEFLARPLMPILGQMMIVTIEKA
ncbi:MAG: class I SAM-dependent methyltransferase [Candidatus Omnitrophota bacterium]